MTRVSNSEANKISSFQLLRAISAIIVILSHINATRFFNGTMGVAFFMIMGGFFSVYVTTKKKKNFFVKKFINITLIYYVMTLCVFFLAKIKPMWFYNTEPSIKNLVKSILFIPYKVPGIGHRPLLDVGWYLNVDMFFCLIYAILNKYFYNKRNKICILIYLVMISINYIFGGDIFILNVYFNFYSLYYIVGILMFYIYQYLIKNRNLPTKTNIYSESIIICLIFMYSTVFKLNCLNLLITSFIFLLFIYFSNIELKCKLYKIGDLSLSIYMIHEFVVKGFDRLIYPLNKFNIFTCIVIILLIVSVCIISYIIEKYRIKFTKKIQNKILNNKDYI